MQEKDAQEEGTQENTVPEDSIQNGQKAPSETSQNFATFSEALSPDIYRQLKKAIELGKWMNGDPLTAQQKAVCLQSIILYENKHFAMTDRVGYVKRKACDSVLKQSALNSAEPGVAKQNPEEPPSDIRWREQQKEKPS